MTFWQSQLIATLLLVAILDVTTSKKILLENAARRSVM